jgi:hypothetical protein
MGSSQRKLAQTDQRTRWFVDGEAWNSGTMLGSDRSDVSPLLRQAGDGMCTPDYW